MDPRDTTPYPRVGGGAKLLYAFAAVYPEPFFVQIGANDGVEMDPLAPFISSFGWRGIMVEPVPYVFERLQANVGGNERIALENVAIADSDGRRAFYAVAEAEDPEHEGLPSSYHVIGSFDRSFLLRHRGLIPDIEQRIVRLDVPCLSFESLCRKHRVDRVDLVAIDVEGYDGVLLRSIDLERRHPRLLIFEHRHLGEADREGCHAFLRKHGYEHATFGWDTWCLDCRAEDPVTDSWRAVLAAG